MIIRKKSYFLSLLLAGLLGLGITYGLYNWAYQGELDKASLVFQIDSNTYRNQLFPELTGADEASNNIVSMFHASTAVDADQFQIYVNQLLSRHPFITSISYMPMVTADNKDKYEQLQQENGFSRFQIKSLSEEKAENETVGYFPLWYLAPFTPSQSSWLGKDPFSSALLRPTIQHAIDTGKSHSVLSPYKRGPLADYLLFTAIYSGKSIPQDAAARRHAVRGVVVMSMQLPKLVHAQSTTQSIKLTLMADNTAKNQFSSNRVNSQNLLNIPAVDTFKSNLVASQLRQNFELRFPGYSYQLSVVQDVPFSELDRFWLFIMSLIGFIISAVLLLFVQIQFSKHRVIESKVQEKTHQLYHLAYFDPLTKLPNRKNTLEKLSEFIANNNTDQDEKVAILFIDLDNFKLVNDSLGHDVGDQLLLEAAQRLSRCVRREDIVGRLGGDEFLILLTGVTSDRAIERVCLDIQSAFVGEISLADNFTRVTPSIGISIYPDNGSDVNELLKYADLAMYASKLAGGNQSSTYSEHISESSNRQLSTRLGSSLEP